MIKKQLFSILSAIFLATVILSFSSAENQGEYPLPTGDALSGQVDADKKVCGDINKVSFSYEAPFLLIEIGYVKPPFSLGASSLSLDLMITSFVSGPISQHPLKLQLSSSGKIKSSYDKDFFFSTAKIKDERISITLNLPSGCRKIGISGTSKLIWEKGWVSDEIKYLKFKPASKQSTPPPTMTKRALSRKDYSPPTGNYVDRGDNQAEADKLLSEAKTEEDKYIAWTKAEEAYKCSDDYSFKRTVIAFLQKNGNKGVPEISPSERIRMNLDRGIEHIRVVLDVRVVSGGGRIRKAEIIEELCEKYSTRNRWGSSHDEKMRFKNSIKDSTFPEIAEIKKKDKPKLLFRLAASATRKKQYVLAYKCYYEYLKYISAGYSGLNREAGEEGMLRSFEKACKYVPKDEEKALKSALTHKAFSEITQRATVHFVFVGPKSFMAKVPEKSLVNFDIAHIIESDLFATPLERQQKRIIVYIKELFGVGSGQGGGDSISISLKYKKGKANTTKIDQHLYFHELAHCLAAYFPVLGLNEGIADLGAQIALELLSKENADARRKNAHKSFLYYFYSRDIPFSDIPSYDPSHGFFAYPFQNRADDGIADWGKLRSAFWDLRKYPLTHPNLYQWTKHYFKILEAYFGKEVYQQYAEAGFPISMEQRFLLQDELDLYQKEIEYSSFRGWEAMERLGNTIISENPESYYHSIAYYDALRGAIDAENSIGQARLRKSLGLVKQLLCLQSQQDLPKAYISSVAGRDSALSRIDRWSDLTGGTPEETLSAKEVELARSDDFGWFEIISKQKSYRKAGLVGYTPNLQGSWDGVAWVTTKQEFTVWIDDRIIFKSTPQTIYNQNYDAFQIPLIIIAPVSWLVAFFHGLNSAYTEY